MAGLIKNQMVPLRPVVQKRVRYASTKGPFIPPYSMLGEILKPTEFILKRCSIPKIISNSYEADLRRADMLLGVDPLFTENTLKNVNIISYIETYKKKKVLETEDIITKVVSKIKIKKGHIEVNLSCPIEELYTKYYSKGVKPPLKERILAYEKIGYTNQQLAKMIKNEDDLKKRSAEDIKFIETIFGDASKKKTITAPKKKTLLQIIGYKKPKYATNEDTEAEAAADA